MSLNKAHRMGVVNELKVAAYYTQNGYHVFLPALTQSEVDMVVTKDSKMYRVQVKTARTDSNGYDVCNLGAKPNAFDRLIAIHPDGRVWDIPATAIDLTKGAVTLGGMNRNYRGWNPHKYLVKGAREWRMED